MTNGPLHPCAPLRYGLPFYLAYPGFRLAVPVLQVHKDNLSFIATLSHLVWRSRIGVDIGKKWGFDLDSHRTTVKLGERSFPGRQKSINIGIGGFKGTIPITAVEVESDLLDPRAILLGQEVMRKLLVAFSPLSQDGVGVMTYFGGTTREQEVGLGCPYPLPEMYPEL